jgi:hypothetical protein
LWCGVLGSTDEPAVGDRVHGQGLLYEAVEEHAPVARRSAVEAECELVEVVRQMRPLDAALMSSEEPALEERGDTVNPGQERARVPAASHDLALVDVPRIREGCVGRKAVRDHQ